MDVNSIIVDNCFTLQLHDGESVYRLNDDSPTPVSVFRRFGGLTMVTFVVFFCSGVRSPLSLLLRFISVLVIKCVALQGFTDEVEDTYADRIYVYNLELHKNYE